jgi:hypothetical protein
VPHGRKVKAIIPGGISTKVVTGEEVDRVRLDNEDLATVGSGMGSGGMVVIAEGTCMVRLLQVLLRFYHHESCGQCTPCREGMGWMHRIIDRIVAGKGVPDDIEQLKKISAWNDGNTICGMGDAAGYAATGSSPSSATSSSISSRTSAHASTGTSNASHLHRRAPDRRGERPDRDAGGRRPRHRDPGLLLAPEPLGVGQLPRLRRAGRGRSWVEISCNMPVAEDLKVLTDTDLVRAYRKSILELTTLNHPVDCGICDKSGECTLQDYHYEHNGAPSNSRDVKVHATKFHKLSERITLDNERCILCSRCVRFTHEVSKSKSLGHREPRRHLAGARLRGRRLRPRRLLRQRGRHLPGGARCCRPPSSTSRASGTCKPTPSVCTLCARGCNVSLWHRKPEWALRTLDARKNVAIERVTPRDNPAVNGPWMCNIGRDLPKVIERPRALQAMCGGAPVTAAAAIEEARGLIAAARHPVALVSSGPRTRSSPHSRRRSALDSSRS